MERLINMPTVEYKGQKVEAENLDFTTITEEWNQYQLADGTVIKVKLVVGKILSPIGILSDDGERLFFSNGMQYTVAIEPKTHSTHTAPSGKDN